MKMISYYRVGDLFFSMDGDGKYYDACADYFSDSARTLGAEDKCLLKIHILNQKDKLKIDEKFYAVSTTIAFNSDTYRVNAGQYIYAVKDLFDPNAPTEVWVKPKKGSRAERICTAFPFRLLLGHHSKYIGFAKRITNYTCLWYIFAITLMKVDSVFLHSGMIGKGDRGIILTGTGGCGKTSTMAELTSKHGWKYVAEDFGILSLDGRIQLMQKKMSIHGSDVKWGNERLITAVNHMKPMSRLEWKLKKLLGGNPRHRFKPSEVYGNDVQESAPVTTIAFLSRSKGVSKLEMRRIDNAEVTERIMNASFRELKELYELLTNIKAVGGPEYTKGYPKVSELETQYAKILSEAVTHATTVHLTLPLNVNPKDTAAAILKAEG